MIFAGLLAIAGFAYYGAHRGIDKTERVAEQAARAELGRDIDVRCPGPQAERIDKPQQEGRVDLGPDGRPKPYTKLSPKTCIGLRVLVQRSTVLDWTCLQQGSCRHEEDSAALGVAVLTHELMHLRGVADEAVAECLARKALPTVAGALRLDPEEIRAVAAYQVQVLEPKLGPQYQGGTC